MFGRVSSLDEIKNFPVRIAPYIAEYDSYLRGVEWVAYGNGAMEFNPSDMTVTGIEEGIGWIEARKNGRCIFICYVVTQDIFSQYPDRVQQYLSLDGTAIGTMSCKTYEQNPDVDPLLLRTEWYLCAISMSKAGKSDDEIRAALNEKFELRMTDDLFRIFISEIEFGDRGGYTRENLKLSFDGLRSLLNFFWFQYAAYSIATLDTVNVYTPVTAQEAIEEQEYARRLSGNYRGKTDAASLVGKSGKLSMRITYENRQYETVEIDGEKQKIYVPFAMLTGMLLDNEIFSNVEVSNGKVVSDGDRTVVIGLALPGLGENLGLDADVVEIPSYVEISADVTNFEMTNTVTVATNELFNKLDLSGFDKIDQLESKLQELNDGVQQLVSGSSELYDGIATLLEKSDELVAGINQLAEGAQKLKDGSGKLTAGAGELKNGAGELADGLHTLVGHNDELNSGAKKVYETLLLTAQTQLEAAGLALPQDLTIENYNTVLSAVKEALSESNVRKQAQAVALEKITEKVEAARPTITAAVTAEVRKNVEAQVTAAVRELAAVLETQGMTLDDYRKGVEAGVISEEQQKAITAAVDAQMASDGVKAKITAATDLQMQTAEVQALISENTDAQVKQLIESNMQSDGVKAQIEEAVAKAKAGVQSIDQLIAGLDEYDEFYKGIADYTDGAKDASDGADALKQGASDLYDGSVTLDAGIRELLTGILKMKDGAPALTDGIGKLKDGSMQLRDGLQILDEQGMQKLTAAVNGDLKELVARVRATVEVSKDYTAFSGISDEMKGSVRFIIRTDAIK